MNYVAPVSDYMARDLILLSPETEINRAMGILLEHGLSGAPVVDRTGQLVGVLSKKDCLKAALDASYYRDWGAKVGVYMTENVETLDAGTDILTAATTFLESTYRRFPVLNGGHLVGQISRSDVLRAMIENWK